jgi:hypothetical protein
MTSINTTPVKLTGQAEKLNDSSTDLPTPPKSIYSVGLGSTSINSIQATPSAEISYSETSLQQTNDAKSLALEKGSTYGKSISEPFWASDNANGGGGGGGNSANPFKFIASVLGVASGAIGVWTALAGILSGNKNNNA